MIGDPSRHSPVLAVGAEDIRDAIARRARTYVPGGPEGGSR